MKNEVIDIHPLDLTELILKSEKFKYGTKPDPEKRAYKLFQLDGKTYRPLCETPRTEGQHTIV